MSDVLSCGTTESDIDTEWEKEMKAWEADEQTNAAQRLKACTTDDQLAEARREMKALVTRFRCELRVVADEHRDEMKKMLSDVMASAALDAAISVKRNLEERGWRQPASLEKIQE
jgi:hypothetical protein